MAQRIFCNDALCLFRFRIVIDVGHVSFENNLASQPSSLRADVDEIVGSAHNFFVMFHDNNRIAQALQFLEHVDKPEGVARMKSDAGLVEDVKAAHERAS